jgi:hypothetical protein
MNSSTVAIIITKNISLKLYNSYSKIFKNCYPVLFISENKTDLDKPDILYYDNFKLLNIHGNYQNLDKSTEFSCYDAFFFYAINNKLKYNHYWLIDADTYIHPVHGVKFLQSYDFENVDFITFAEYYSKKYINEEIQVLDNKNYWQIYVDSFKPVNIRSSCNVICRISKKFISHIDGYRKNNNKFLPNNILFPSIAKAHNLKQIVYTKPLKNILINSNKKFNKPKNGFDKVNLYKTLKKLDDLANNTGNIVIYPFPEWFKHYTF